MTTYDQNPTVDSRDPDAHAKYAAQLDELVPDWHHDDRTDMTHPLADEALKRWTADELRAEVLRLDRALTSARAAARVEARRLRHDRDRLQEEADGARNEAWELRQHLDETRKANDRLQGVIDDIRTIADGIRAADAEPCDPNAMTLSASTPALCADCGKRHKIQARFETGPQASEGAHSVPEAPHETGVTPANPEEPWRSVWRSPSGRTELAVRTNEIIIYRFGIKLLHMVGDDINVKGTFRV